MTAASNRQPVAVRRWRPAPLGACLLAVVCVGWFDYVTGPDIGFSLFYLLPIAWAAWRAGRLAGIIVAIVASITWLLADLVLRDPGRYLISAWNGFTRLAIFSMLGMLLSALRDDRDRLSRLNTQLNETLARESAAARTDALTGLANSRAFQEALATEMARVRRDGRSLSLALVDLDNFKRVNDTRGHAAGDAVLAQVAKTLMETIRAGDVAARIGGDEFVIMFVGLDAEGARRVAWRFVERVRDIGKSFPECDLGVSVGIATMLDPALEDGAALLRRADEAMYRAKSQGKCCVVTSEGPLSASLSIAWLDERPKTLKSEVASRHCRPGSDRLATHPVTGDRPCRGSRN